MAHWFHRNPLKATASLTFESKTGPTSQDAFKLCSELNTTRLRLTDLLSDHMHGADTIETTFNSYASLLHGFVVAMDDRGGDSKLRLSMKFKWTNTLLGTTPEEQQDILFEINCMKFNVALWFTKHAAALAGSKEEPTLDEAKEVHKCLRKAAGIFDSILKSGDLAKLYIRPPEAGDLDERVLNAYISQSTAEAQEITVARAIELKHSPSLISALAYETSKLFTTAAEGVRALDPKIVGKWQKYLELKSIFYQAYAYNFFGDDLLTKDECGKAIRCLKEGVTCYGKAEALCKEYAIFKGAGATVHPERHLFFRKLKPIITRTLEKCERENGFIYHHKVPLDVPQLELKATYGLVSPEEFKPPAPHALWSTATYASFDISKPKPLEKKSAAGQVDKLEPVKEKASDSNVLEPKTSSGCVIS